MQPTQRNNIRFPVYPHPWARSRRAAVEDIQLRTGLLFIINPKNSTTPIRLTAAVAPEGGNWPFGGDAA